MASFGVDWVYLVGALVIAAGVAAVLFVSLGSIAVILYIKTRKVFIPTATLIVVNLFELPIKQVLWIFGFDGEFLDNMVVSLRNTLYRKTFSETSYDTRALFIPQCLRNPRCPAKLSGEGIDCVNCGLCGLGELKKFAEGLGYHAFIVPGSSFVKRMIKKYRPKAVLGVGCLMEVNEGTVLVSSIGIPVQSVTLLRDGCINTRVDVMNLIEKIVSCRGIDFTTEHKKLSDRIASMWNQKTSVSPEDEEDAKERFRSAEENILHVRRRLW
jgi:hypothetical protein